ncbi:MAG TPA: hypothetical protein VML55_23725 [Planctomycetaceae bacterium]|nr:hypothetical protein [Planctomycetaceae bacterium]
MNPSAPDWLSEGLGDGPPPRLRWSFTTDGPLVDLAVARETGDVLAGDETGGLYRLDRRGRVQGVSRGFRSLDGLAWSDTGRHGAAILGRETVCLYDNRLEIQWRIDLRDTVTALAIDPRGNYVGIGLEGRRVAVYTAAKQRVARFATLRPLTKLVFLVSVPELLGAAEAGLLGRFRLNGDEVWAGTDWSNIGDLCATTDGSTVFVAAFTHGIRIVSAAGQSSGAYLVEGTPARVATTASGQRLIAATVERRLYWMDAEGSLLWTTTLPDDVVRLACDPLGRWTICGLAGGRIVRLDWPDE